MGRDDQGVFLPSGRDGEPKQRGDDKNQASIGPRSLDIS